MNVEPARQVVDRIRRAAQTSTLPPLEAMQVALRTIDDPAVLVTNDAGEYIACNEAAVTLTGYSPADLTTRSVWELTPETTQHQFETLWRAFLQRGVQYGEYDLATKSGEIVRVAYYAETGILAGMHVSIMSNLTHTGRRVAGRSSGN
jgi:PAS domain S-box-containing protein